MERAAGLLCHPTSLPGPHGCGDLGEPARRFVDFLAGAGQRWWQMLPVVPVGAGNSPYSSPSAFAGNELLIPLGDLAEEGWLEKSDLAATLPDERVDYVATRELRLDRLKRAFAKLGGKSTRELEAYRKANRDWLDDYALFRAVKDAHGGGWWRYWNDEDLRARKPKALAAARKRYADGVLFHEFCQWRFDVAWRRLREYARGKGVGLIGDAPIFVEHDSADVWSHREYWQLDREGLPKAVAGVPPDYFSATGQLWGNPLYDWKALARRKFDWWVKRISRQLERFDLIRLDHFIGFHRAWAVPATEKTALNGTWQKGPNDALFLALRKKLGALPLLAEDLGLLIEPVKELRDRFDLPGMRVLQFAFGDDPEADNYKPYRYVPNCVVYTGTHDNDTTVGWFRDAGGAASTRDGEQIRRERETALRYLASDGSEVHWDMIRAAFASVANLAIVPLQDVLGLGSEARMNRPGVGEGNWEWRFREGDLREEHMRRLRSLAEVYGRTPRQRAAAETARAPKRRSPAKRRDARAGRAE